MLRSFALWMFYSGLCINFSTAYGQVQDPDPGPNLIEVEGKVINRGLLIGNKYLHGDVLKGSNLQKYTMAPGGLVQMSACCVGTVPQGFVEESVVFLCHWSLKATFADGTWMNPNLPKTLLVQRGNSKQFTHNLIITDQHESPIVKIEGSVTIGVLGSSDSLDKWEFEITIEEDEEDDGP